MQKQIIVPFATAIVAQTANALTLQDHLNPVSQISANPLELAQAQMIDEAQACRDAVAVKKAKREDRCRKRNKNKPDKLEACLAKIPKWEKNQLNKCLPCDVKVIRKHETKHAQCSKKKKEKQRNKCYAKWDAWRDSELKKCSPNADACEASAKWEREQKRFECLLIEDPEERNQCNAEADQQLNEALEICGCKEKADEFMQPQFAACEEIDDADEQEDCIDQAQADLEEMHLRCEGIEPTCDDYVQDEYEAMIAECDGIEDPEKKEQCYAHAKKTRDEGLRYCDCKENVHDQFEEKFEHCNSLPAAQQQQCHEEVDQHLMEALKECEPQPPNCWEVANANFEQTMAMCEMYDNDEEIRNCEEKAFEQLNKDAEECQIQECYEKMEAEMAPHFEKCDNMGPLEDQEGCYAEAEALLQELKDKHCHPKPNCWEEAQAFLDEQNAMCEEKYPDDGTAHEDREACFKEVKMAYMAWTEECRIAECYDQVHEQHAPMFEECEKYDEAADREECHKKVHESLQEALQWCHPQVNCWEEAEAFRQEHEAMCDEMTDETEQKLCWASVEEKYQNWIEECRVGECYEKMEAEVAPHFEKCDNMGPTEDQEGCYAEAEALLQELKDKHCHPQPNCWEQARAHYDKSRAECDTMTDQVEKEICYEKVENEYDVWTQNCAIRECEENAHEIHAEKFKYCDTLHGVDKDQCHKEVSESLKEMIDQCYPQPNCWEEADAHLQKRLEECYKNTDAAEVAMCELNAKNEHAHWIEECRIMDCHEQVNAEFEPQYKECEAMTDPEEQRPCIERVDKLLQEAMEQCYPTCWEQAWAHFERTNAMCALKQDPEEKEICLKESDRVYVEWTQGCDQRECHEKAHQIAEAGFKECETTDPNADGVTDAAELAECQKQVEVTLKEMLEECEPKPPLTCEEEANEWLDERIAECKDNTDGNEVEMCIKKYKEEHAMRVERCRLEECYDNVHTHHEPLYAACYDNAMYDDTEIEMCLEKVREAEMAMRDEECHPKPPTCAEEASEWLNNALAQCDQPVLKTTLGVATDETNCHQQAHQKYEAMMEECSIKECKERTRAENEWMYEGCQMVVDEDYHECIAKVDKDIAEIIQRTCYPEPTCYDEAYAWLQNALKECDTEPVLFAQVAKDEASCHDIAYARHEQMVTDCQQRECKDNIYAELEPRYNACYDGPASEVDECVEKLNKYFEELVQEHCLPKPPTCIEAAETFYAEGKQKCYDTHNDQIEIETCIEGVSEERDAMLHRCEISDCFANAEAYYAEKKAYCHDTHNDQNEIDLCMEGATEKRDALLERCRIGECLYSVTMEFKPKLEACADHEDPEKQQACLEEVTAAQEQAYEECYPQEPEPPTCAELAEEQYAKDKQECQVNFADPEPCMKDAETRRKDSLEKCAILECQEKVIAEFEQHFAECDDTSLTAAQRSQCYAETQDAFDKKLRACEPVVDQMDDFNWYQLDGHNRNRTMHQSQPLAYDHEIAVNATAYAQWLYDNDKWEHSDSSDRPGQGENLYWGTYSDVNSSDRASRSWYSEISDYDYEDPGKSTGVIGHFTQMMWNATDKMGCGVAGGSDKGYFVVCRYAPAGNVRHWSDKWLYYRENVKPPVAL